MSKTAYIIGMGPAGLTSALSLLSRGYSVVLLDQRSEQDLFKRKQQIFLKPETIDDFFSLSNLDELGYTLEFRGSHICQLIRPEDESSLNLTEGDQLDLKFFELIERERECIPIGELQRYQLAKLNQIYLEGGYIFENGLDTLDIRFDKALQKLIILNSTKIVSVDAEQQVLVIDNNGVVESHQFDLLVDASGKTAKSFTPLWNTQNPDYAVQYEHVDNPEHKTFGVMAMSITNPALSMIRTPVLTPFTKKSCFLPLPKISHLKDLGWEHEHPPLVYFKYSKKQGNVYLTGEIPQRIHDNNNPLELKYWFDLIMRLLFNNSDFKTDQVSLSSVFTLNIEIADQYAMALPNGGFYCLVGDALMSSNLLLGSGVCNALADANILYDMVEVQFAERDNYRKERIEEYQARCIEFADLVQEKLELLDSNQSIDNPLQP